MAQASSSSTDHGETGSSNHILLLYNYTFSLSSAETHFDVNSVVFELHKARFPADKWQSLASGLKMATAVPIIDADCRTSVCKLLELIRKWVQGSSTTAGNQWVMLIDAVVMCDEPAVAQELATAVGCPLARSGTTTQHV